MDDNNIDISKYSIGVIVARMQVHELHEAHHWLIKQVANNHKKVILFLGVPKIIGTKKNPLDFDSRKKMIQEHYPEIVISALPDINDDEKWAKELDKRIREVYSIGDVLMYGARDSFIPYYKKGKGQFDTKELEQYTFISGTEVRKIISEQVKNSPDFRAGVIYQSYNQYPKVYPYINIAVLNEDESKVLLCKKPNQDKWRFIGGFSKPQDDSYEQTAIRKFLKIAGFNSEIGGIKYIGSKKIDDWRYRSEEDKVISMLFEAKYIFGRIEPSQDISELKWFDIKWIQDSWINLNNEINDGIIKDHQDLLKMFIDKKLK